MTKRVIARLDIKGPNLVKGIHLEGLRALGRPKDFAKFYYESGADELIYQDVVASLYDRNSLKDFIKETAREIFIPLTVGGGLRTLDDIKEVLRSGADKVCLNTAALKNPELVKQAASKFGSSTIVVAIEAIKRDDGNYYAFMDNGREFSGKEVTQWAREVESLGAGEVLLTSVDKEGTGKGCENELLENVSSILEIPVIYHGGIASADDIKKSCQAGADGVAVASIIHYDRVFNIEKENLTDEVEGNFDFIKKSAAFSRFKTSSITDLKKQLRANNISCRL